MVSVNAAACMLGWRDDGTGHAHGHGANLSQAKGLFLRTRREPGTAARMRAHSRSTSGVTLASALNEPKVTNPARMRCP